ncbi:MAG: hypothetical protein IJG51_06610, partial [Synergistaceae bacterium]|nr:hypothetical protein [Synergistaceae bacterium]
PYKVSDTKTPLAAIRYTSKEGVYTYASPSDANLFSISDLFQIVKDNDSSFNPNISIHAPTKGATRRAMKSLVAFREFQSTPPRRERHSTH